MNAPALPERFAAYIATLRDASDRTSACIAFDDSLPHEIWTDSDRDRVVLVVDGLHRYIAHGAEGLRRYWSMNQT